MTESVTDCDKTFGPVDNDGEKRVKFENRRYKLIKVHSLFCFAFYSPKKSIIMILILIDDLF